MKSFKSLLILLKCIYLDIIGYPVCFQHVASTFIVAINSAVNLIVAV